MVPKSPERLLKRMIRGMLPWDRTRGVEAWKRLICHVGNPGEVKDAKKLNIKKPFKYMTLEEVCKILK
jgi:large subunit ribosomal protein L13